MKMTIRLILSLIMMTSVVLAGTTDEKEAKAIAAGRAWLALCDQGKYGESWEESAVFFQDALLKGQWEQALTNVRTPLGKVEQRDVKHQKYKTSLPNAPDGEYVIIQFSTSFENKKESIETVTMMMDKDRGWRVSGYYIK